jgi:hypothetical protein
MEVLWFHEHLRNHPQNPRAIRGRALDVWGVVVCPGAGFGRQPTNLFWVPTMPQAANSAIPAIYETQVIKSPCANAALPFISMTLSHAKNFSMTEGVGLKRESSLHGNEIPRIVAHRCII